MSNTNYDLAIPLSFDNTYRHYIINYKVAVPSWLMEWPSYNDFSRYLVIISFDDGRETEISYIYSGDKGTRPALWYNTDQPGGPLLPDSGVLSTAYLRNPKRNIVTFTRSNCSVLPYYTAKAPFEVKFNNIGFAANQNASFKCSTIQKPTYKQYEWTSATVYYKKSGASSYSSASGTVSGSWSDVTVRTGISLQDGYTYNIYIRAVADDGTVATTSVENFTTTDAPAVAKCISPVGAFLQGSATFVWSHSTEYGTPQYAYDLQYSTNNGSTWTNVASHEVTQNTSVTVTLADAGVYLWRVRTYNSNDVVGEWAEASFVNNMPAQSPTNLSVSTKGRPTVEWASSSQIAYQIQILDSNSIVYDSGAVYTSQTSHFVNKYLNDEISYNVRVRIYNALGEVSEWAETGYQQPSVNDINFIITKGESGGARIVIEPDEVFTHYYLLRNNKLIAEITDDSYTDMFAAGTTNYSVVAVTSDDQSDIQTKSFVVEHNCAEIITLDGQQIPVNKRVDQTFEIQTSNEVDINKVKFIGDSFPTHYPSDLRLKSFAVSFFDDQDICESILGKIVYYSDNFGNGGYCMASNYDKKDNFVQNSRGIYANEVSLTLEVTNYDDTIQYPV